MSHRWFHVGHRGSLCCHLVRKTSLDPIKEINKKEVWQMWGNPRWTQAVSILCSGWHCWAQSQWTRATSRNAHFQPRLREQGTPQHALHLENMAVCVEDRLRLSGGFWLGLSWSKHRGYKGSGSWEKLGANRQRAWLWLFMSDFTSLPSEVFRESKQMSWVINLQDKTQMFFKSKNPESVSWITPWISLHTSLQPGWEGMGKH